MDRRDKINYYLDIAQTVAERSTCFRKFYGAIIVKNDEIIATGYNGAPRGRKNCVDENYCVRQKLNIPRGQRYEICRSVHAEANAIISAPRSLMIGSDIYLCGIDPTSKEICSNIESCSMCKRLIINAGIERVFIRQSRDEYRIVYVQHWIDNDDSLTGTDTY